jgi:hypothetical protein
MFDVKSTVSTDKEYDLVVACTGYKYKQGFRILHKHTDINVDVYNLINYMFPLHVPNMIFCLPIAVSTYIQIENMLPELKECINKHLHDTCWTIDQRTSNEYLTKRTKMMLENQLTKKDIQWHGRHDTYIYVA